MNPNDNEPVLSLDNQPEFCGHLGNGCGICAPPVLAADQRLLLSRAYFTLPYIMICGIVPGLPPTSDGRFRPRRLVYAGGYTGIGQRGDTIDGDGTAIDDVQTGLHTSFATDGYPLKDRTLRVEAIGIMPRGRPFVPTHFAGPAPALTTAGLGGSSTLPGERVMIPEVSEFLGPAIISSFFSEYRFQLGLQDEDTKWIWGPQEMNIPGLGLHGRHVPSNSAWRLGQASPVAGGFASLPRRGAMPTNAMPVEGRMIRLPYAIDVPPQQSRKGIITATWEFVRDIFGAEAWFPPSWLSVGPTPICNGGDSWTNVPVLTTPKGLVQLFTIFLYGTPHADLEIEDKVREFMAETGCDEDAARKLCATIAAAKRCS